MTTPGDIRAVKMLENQSAPTSLSLEAGELPITIKTRTHRNNNHHHQQSTSSHNYYRKLLTPLLIISTLLAELHQASGAEFNKIQKRYSVMQDPAQLLSSAQATPETDSEQHARQLADQRRQLVSLAMANILHKNQVAQQQQRSLWTQDPSPAFHHHQQQQHQQQQAEQFVSYRPMVAASTMPTINRQIQPPNPFYELSFAPTNTLQIEHQHDSASNNNNNQDNHHQHQPQLNQLDEQEPHFASAMSQPSPVRLEPPSQQHQQQQQDLQAAGTTARSIELPHEQAEQQQQHQQSEVNQMTSETNGNNNKGGESARNSQQPDLQQQQQQQQQQPPASVDKIEPRQRRRLFNRILKKAEWNHLFVELSKVFLKYFLDLALKDIIGKQSGSTSSSSGSETTSRKKLDAQSELADLLKEFVKNAISNI